ncbi:MAG: hypothetical protein ABF969_04110 [Sporolactobacillus sp.]
MSDLKTFVIKGQRIEGELRAAAQKNNLTQSQIRNRVYLLSWTIEAACKTPIGQRPVISIPPASTANPVKHYFLSPTELDEIWKKYGRPGQLIKDYSQTKAPIGLRGSWNG